MSFNITVPNKGKHHRKRPLIISIIGTITICSAIIPIAVLFLFAWAYQQIYFSIYDIPKLKFKDYAALDRGKLKKLNIIQKINCVYCGFTNCTLAWAKEIANQTEAYSCAIKHSVFKPGQEHQKDYYPYSEFK